VEQIKANRPNNVAVPNLYRIKKIFITLPAGINMG
jgi:hypothetical protein